MAQHSTYWSCSNFANWLRGTDKLSKGTAREWTEWDKSAKNAHPFRFWLAEDLLDTIQDFVYWPFTKLNDIRYYINNRWVTKSHSLVAHPRNIKPGAWQDVGYRLLPCMFNALADFVEIEQAWAYVMWDKDKQHQYKTPWWRKSFFRLRSWRSPEAGLAYLEWASSLIMDERWGLDKSHPEYGKPSHQAADANEIKELYIWWTDTYPNRPDPYDISGWDAVCSKKRDGDHILSIFDNDDETDEEKAHRHATHTRLREIEKEYEQEEEDMMIRMIKIRKSLWT